MYKKRDQGAKFFFANRNLFNLFAFSLPLTSPLLKLPINNYYHHQDGNNYHCLIIIIIILQFVVDALSRRFNATSYLTIQTWFLFCQRVLVILPVAKTTVPVSLDSQRKNIGVYVLLVSLVNNVNMVSCSWKRLSFYANNQRFVNRNQARAVLCHFLRQCIKRLRSEHFRVSPASCFNWSINCHTISNASSSNFCFLCS